MQLGLKSIRVSAAIVLLAVSGVTWAEGGPATAPSTSPASQPTTTPTTAPTTQPVVRYVPPQVVPRPPHSHAPVASPNTVEELETIQAQVEKVVPTLMSATVGISVGAAQGSGVIVSADGYILTAGHVSDDPNRECTLIFPDGKRVKGITLGANHIVDSGMIKITDKPGPGGWPFVQMGTSNDLQLGEWAIALGHPGGYRVGRPPVVRLGRITHNVFGATATISTDNTLVGGDSGGPLFDLAGHLIGINSRIAPSTSLNMHVPVDSFVAEWDKLAHSEQWGPKPTDSPRFNVPSPPKMGVGVDELPNNAGLKLTRVDVGSPADKAGLRVGDEVFKINNQPVRNTNEMLQILLQQRAGNVINIYIRRPEAEDQMLRVKLAGATKAPGQK